MTSLQESARQLVLAGRTTVSEYSRLVQDVRWKDGAKKYISENLMVRQETPKLSVTSLQLRSVY